MEQMITEFAGLGIVGLIGGYLFTTFMKERAEERKLVLKIKKKIENYLENQLKLLLKLQNIR